MEEASINDEKSIEWDKVDPWRVVIVCCTIIVTCLIVLALYLGAAHSCKQLGGQLDPMLKCHSKYEVERLKQPIFISCGERVFDFELNATKEPYGPWK